MNTTTHKISKIDDETFTYRGLIMRKTTRCSYGNHKIPTWSVHYSNGVTFVFADTKPKLAKAIDQLIFDDYDTFKKPIANFTGFTWKYIADGVIHIGDIAGKTPPDTTDY